MIMALIAIASDKGAPGVTTAALALAAVWPRPVLLAECDPAGGDLVYRFPAAGGGHLDPRRGVLSLAVIARRGMAPHQVWEHAQKLHGGLDVLAGVTNAEQGAGLSLLWGPIGKVLASLPQADVIADCGRLGADGPLYDLLAEATTVVLVSRVHVADVIRLRDRATAFAAAAQSRGRRGFGVGVVVVTDHKKLRASLGEVQQVLTQANAPAAVLGGIAHDTKGADLLSGEWGGSLDRTLLIKTARQVAQQLVHALPPIGSPATANPAAAANPAGGSAAAPSPAGNPQVVLSVGAAGAPAPAGSSYVAPAPAGSSYGGPTPAGSSYPGPTPTAPSRARPLTTEARPPAPSSLPGSQEAPGSSQASRPAAEVPAGTPVAENPDAGTSATGVSAARRGSPAGSRTAFTRVLGSRSGRHQADPGQGGRTSGPPVAASSAAAVPDQAPDSAQAQVGYVSAPVTSTPPASTPPANTQAARTHAASTQAASAQAASADPGRPAARHAQQTAPPATDAPGYSRTPMSPLQPGDAGFLAGGYQDSRAQDSDFQDSRAQDSDFQDSRAQDSDFQDSRSQGDISWPSDAQASRFPVVDFQAGYAGRRAPEPLEADPPAAPADRPDSPRPDSPRPDSPRPDSPRPDSPRQDDPEWGSSEWNTSPGPMGSRRPGRG
jgi:MinD-like ATPase involved in chromosome partitioning or flagellar assembly